MELHERESETEWVLLLATEAETIHICMLCIQINYVVQINIFWGIEL